MGRRGTGMSTTEQLGEEFSNEVEPDPFDAENAPGINLIVNLRIYDVLMAILRESNPEVQKDLARIHASGKILSTAPMFDGTFITDEINQAMYEQGHDFINDEQENS
jgi:hypothetical protein